MPNWKKLVTSGSNALLNTLNVTNGITGSLFGSASWSNNTLTASVVTATGNQGVIAYKGTTFLTSSNNLYYNSNLILNNGKIWQSDSNLWYTILGSTGQASANENGLFSYDSNLDNIYPVVSYDQAANKYYFANYQVVYNGTNGNTGIGTTVPGAKLEVNGNVKATSFTGSLQGTSSWATNAITASFVNTLNQNVLITGSLTVGATSLGANENTLVLGPSPAGGTGEGGQILFQAPGGTYTSASMWDNYQNQTRLLRGTNAGSDAVVASFNMHTKQVQFPSYNALNAFSGTPVAALGVNSNGDIITIQTGSGAGGGGGSTFQAGTNVDNRLITATGTTPELNGEAGLTFDGKALAVTGEVTASGAIRSLANGAMYFRGGDDAEFWDINVANTVGIYGQQNADRAGLKLGSSGPTLFGSSSKFGIGTITPTLATLEVNGNIYATSFTGSLFGTSSWSNNSVTASTINTSGNSNSVIYYPTFVDTNGTGIARTLYTDSNSSIRVNPGLGYLYATQFIGTASWAGSSSLANTSSYSITASYAVTSSWASTSLSINTIRNNTNATFYPVFVDSNNNPSSNESLYTESTITFNPNIGSLNVTSITASLRGTASTASFVTSSNVYGPLGSNSILSASYASYALTASYALSSPGGGGSPAGNQGNIQINSGSGQFYGDSGFSYLPSAERKIVHSSNREFDTNYYDQNANGAIQLSNISSSIAPFNHSVNLVQKSKSIQPNIPTVVMGFDVQNSANTHLKVTGFKCDYSILYLESSPSVAISNTRTGTLLATWAWDGTTTNITDNYVIADINGVLKDGIFTLAFNGTNIELTYDSGGTITESCIFTGLFTIFSNK